MPLLLLYTSIFRGRVSVVHGSQTCEDVLHSCTVPEYSEQGEHAPFTFVVFWPLVRSNLSSTRIYNVPLLPPPLSGVWLQQLLTHRARAVTKNVRSWGTTDETNQRYSTFIQYLHTLMSGFRIFQSSSHFTDRFMYLAVSGKVEGGATF